MYTRKIALPLLFVACSIYAQAQKNQAAPPPPPVPPKVEIKKFPPPVIKDEKTLKNDKAFYNRNKNVSHLSWKEGHMVTVYLKDKSQEKYDLNNREQKKMFTDKYGESPVPPPPPPPASLKGKIKAPPPPPEPPKAGNVKFTPPVIVKDK